MKTPVEIIRELDAGAILHSDVIHWASCLMSKDMPLSKHPLLFELALLYETVDEDISKLRPIIEKLVLETTSFEISTEQLKEFSDKACEILENASGSVIHRSNFAEFMLGVCPGVAVNWEEVCREYVGIEPGIYRAMGALSNYTEQLLQQKNAKELLQVNKLVEALLMIGDDEIQEATVVGFLEGITNRCLHEPESLDMEFLLDYLGPRAIQACRELDEFWGSK